MFCHGNHVYHLCNKVNISDHCIKCWLWQSHPSWQNGVHMCTVNAFSLYTYMICKEYFDSSSGLVWFGVTYQFVSAVVIMAISSPAYEWYLILIKVFPFYCMVFMCECMHACIHVCVCVCVIFAYSRWQTGRHQMSYAKLKQADIAKLKHVVI